GTRRAVVPAAAVPDAVADEGHIFVDESCPDQESLASCFHRVVVLVEDFKEGIIRKDVKTFGFAFMNQAAELGVSIEIENPGSEGSLDRLAQYGIQRFAISENHTHGDCSTFLQNEVRQDGEHRWKALQHVARLLL